MPASTDPGAEFAAWLQPQLDPQTEAPAPEPVPEGPRRPKPDPSQGAQGVPAAPRDGVTVLADMLDSIHPSTHGDGWYDAADVKTGGWAERQFRNL